ncbi:MAG TPA: alpha/beta hydrolase, partial [Microthrixaceae bacterium]|nr:alpha/beta hydrolase [Microthrixaceae bacterium]
EVEAQTYEMGPRHSAFDHLDEVQCPVTVLRGSESFPGPASLAPLVADRLPNGRLEEHPELGHFGPLENPATMGESIRNAIAGDSGS